MDIVSLNTERPQALIFCKFKHKLCTYLICVDVRPKNDSDLVGFEVLSFGCGSDFHWQLFHKVSISMGNN